MDTQDGAAVAAGCRRLSHFVHISLVIVIGQSEIMYSIINYIVEFEKRLIPSKLMHVWSAIVIRGPVKAQSTSYAVDISLYYSDYGCKLSASSSLMAGLLFGLRVVSPYS